MIKKMLLRLLRPLFDIMLTEWWMHNEGSIKSFMIKEQRQTLGEVLVRLSNLRSEMKGFRHLNDNMYISANDIASRVSSVRRSQLEMKVNFINFKRSVDSALLKSLKVRVNHET